MISRLLCVVLVLVAVLAVTDAWGYGYGYGMGYGMYRPFMGKFFFHEFTHLRTAWKPRALTPLETVQELFLNFWHYFA
ncbi:hypothetical protein WR25_16061 [Diploscapter pachys]|uniref:Uncharacterized protein n=1 Tax=Diploscapter pachys TaxID=2018661 RepID=A0A2A2KJ41_9BILA|nr:hypothetical protein WR25_16061 [Diploscapter pachys]